MALQRKTTWLQPSHQIPLILGMAAACKVLALLLRLGHWADLKASVNKGVFGFMLRVLNTASEVGYGAELLHRVAVLAAGGMDTLPHCGAIITLLAICKLTHTQSYLNIAAVTMVFPVTALIALITLGTVFGSF